MTIHYSCEPQIAVDQLPSIDRACKFQGSLEDGGYAEVYGTKVEWTARSVRRLVRCVADEKEGYNLVTSEPNSPGQGAGKQPPKQQEAKGRFKRPVASHRQTLIYLDEMVSPPAMEPMVVVDDDDAMETVADKGAEEQEEPQAA